MLPYPRREDRQVRTPETCALNEEILKLIYVHLSHQRPNRDPIAG